MEQLIASNVHIGPYITAKMDNARQESVQTLLSNNKKNMGTNIGVEIN